MLHDFTYRFQKVYKSCPLFLVVLHGLIGTLLHSSHLEGSDYDCLWSWDKDPWYKNISSTHHHCLSPGITFFDLFSQEKSFRGKERHTHTHTHTHTYQCQVFHKVPCDDVLQESFHSLKPVHYEISIGEEEETDDTVNDNDFDEIVTMSSTSAMA